MRAIMEAIRDLGLLSLDPVEVKGQSVVPRDVFVKVAGERLRKPDGHDLVALRVLVTGEKAGRATERAWQMVARYDDDARAHGDDADHRLHAVDHGAAAGHGRDAARRAHARREHARRRATCEMLAERGIVVEALQ